MKRMTKRIFCFVLSLCLVTLVGVPVASAMKEGPWDYAISQGEAYIMGYDQPVQGHLDIPETLGGAPVTSIRFECFMGCRDLTSVTFPSTLTVIKNWAFNGTGLTTVTIPKTLTEIQVGAFADCLSLTEIIVEEGNPNYISIDGVLYTKDLSRLMQYPSGKQGERYEMPHGVKELDHCAVSSNPYLKEVVIADTVKKTGYLAFIACENLVDVTVPPSVEEFGHEPFGGAYNDDLYDWPLVPGFTIHGYAGTYAETYTLLENLEFHVLNELGDNNHNLRIDAEDALIALQISVEKIYALPAQVQVSDVNQDTLVTAKDALEILKKTVGNPACF